MALQGGPCRASVQESLYYLRPHHPGFKGEQTCLRAVVQFPLIALEAHPPPRIIFFKEIKLKIGFGVVISKEVYRL